MPTDIKCPNCGHQFEPNEAIREEVQKELRAQAADWQKKKNEEFNQKLDEEKKRIQQSVEENLRKSISSDFENRLRLAEQNNKDNEEKLKLSRQKELEFLKKEKELKTKEEELELSVQKKVLEEREKLSKEIRKIEDQRMQQLETDFKLKLAEKDKQLEDQKKLADEMRRKAEQGSMQLQGEVQEIALEEMLRSAFPFDMITEVGKGVRGADCLQIIRNNFGQECGKIIYESKRTNAFAADWIEKLKADMRSQGAEIAVIVTKTMPRDMDCFGIKDGVWICSFGEVKALAAALRDSIVRTFNATKSNENKGDKMHLLYGYLTSNEFAEQWKAIREGFMSMKLSIQKERDAMEKLWKAREKQLEKVLLNAAHIRGSIEGISGSDVDLNLLEAGDDEEEE
ncbi:MAG: DUF2130 domain-containing protein [Bacteroidetes bacterium]|jgi:hypothetical protein|nr:MAG: DUF2130 domain-containing protein [Bacteroidota bacterium]